MKVRMIRNWEQLTTNFWFIPACMALFVVLLAGLMLFIDAKLQNAPVPILKWLYISGPSGARALLSTIAASAITVTSIIFSLTIVTLSMASSQFGPRLLPNFMQQSGTQLAQGTFIATFIYALLILSRIPDAPVEDSFPHLSVVIGLILGIISFFVLIYFVHHVSMYIRVSRVLDDVANNSLLHMRKIFPEGIGKEPPEDLKRQDSVQLATTSNPSHVITTTKSGYLQAIDTGALMALALENDIVVRLRVRPGHFVVKDHPVAEVVRGNLKYPDKIDTQLNDSLIIGPERTSTQDVEFAVEQLVEVGVRALSPGINDPFTAINCIDRIGSVLSYLAYRELPNAFRYDDKDVLRVVANPYTYKGIINTAFDQLRQASRGEVSVSLRLLETIQMLGEQQLPNEFQETLATQARSIYFANKESFEFENDRIDLEKRFHVVNELLKI